MQHSLSDRIAIISSIPLLSTLRKKSITHLAKSADEYEYETETRVVVQGDAADACYVITDGEAAVYRNGRKVADLGPGSVFGELSVLDGGERTATVVMKTRGSLLRISKPAFDDLLDSSPTVGKRLLVELAGRLRAADRKIYG
jgi:CRP/FNR family cyclic AMP-dependent transcriptional regulator